MDSIHYFRMGLLIFVKITGCVNRFPESAVNYSDINMVSFFFLYKCMYLTELYTGEWRFIIFVLLFTDITCTRMSLKLTEDMHVIKNVKNYNFNETVTISCISGFIRTTVTSQCTNVNKWSHTPPICTSKTLFSAISNPIQYLII